MTVTFNSIRKASIFSELEPGQVFTQELDDNDAVWMKLKKGENDAVDLKDGYIGKFNPTAEITEIDLHIEVRKCP